jgi:hypothetical protein
MVGSGEGKVQVLNTFGPLNADLRPWFIHNRWQVNGGVLWQPSLSLTGK